MIRSPIVSFLATCFLLSWPAAAWSLPGMPPSPHRILTGQAPSAGFVDATAVCLPGEGIAALAEAREQARAGDWLAARQLLRSAAATQAPAVGTDALDAALLDAVMKLRPDPAAPRRRALEAELREGGSRPALACAHLELARAQLLAGLIPEASTSTLRAVRSRDVEELPAGTRDTYRFLRAEAMLLSGRPEEARPHYEGVRESANRKLAAASALRLATLPSRPDDEKRAPRATYVAVKQLHDEAQAAHLDTDPWASRLGELALEADLADAAHIWFARAQESAGDGSPEVIRRADALALAGRDDEARLLLQHLIERRGTDPVGTLARVRLADLELWQDDEAVLRRRLQVAARHLHPRVAAYALDVLAHELQQAGDLDAALAARARLLREDVSPGLVRHSAEDLGTLLAAVGSADSDCIDVVRRLGSAREVFIAHAPDPAPLLRLGDCYLALGMVEPGRSVYRSLSRAFGTEVVAELPYRLAQASYGGGEVPAVEAAVRAALAATGRTDTGRWLYLRARLEIDAGDTKAGAATLLECLAAPGLDAADRREALLILSRVGDAAPESWRVVAALELAKQSLWPAHAVLAAEQRGELALHLADADPSGTHADTWYRMAAKLLPAGSMRDRAAFQIGELGSGARESERDLPSTYWTRIVDVDASVARLASRLGVDR